MKPIPNAGAVLRHAWSVRLMGLSGFLQIAQALLPYAQDYIPPKVFLGLSLASLAGAGVARFIQQKRISDGQ